MKQNKGTVVFAGQCAVCSKPVNEKNGCRWTQHAMVHNACLPRIVNAAPQKVVRATA